MIQQRRAMRWLGPLAGPIDRFLSGSKPRDPLYLTNQTTGQKVRRALLIGIPILIVGVTVLAAFTNLLPRKSRPYTEPSAAELAARKVAALPLDVKVETNT